MTRSRFRKTCACCPSLLGAQNSIPPSIFGRTYEKMKQPITTFMGLSLWNGRYVLALIAWLPIQRNFGQ